MNGKAFPETVELYTKYGRKILIRLINNSRASHSIHVHGHDFQVTKVNGFSRCNIYDDTINEASVQRREIEFLSNNTGTFPINGTKPFIKRIMDPHLEA
ncbi:multicopper oxidase domain-containing protein [Bacillus sp. AK031]